MSTNLTGLYEQVAKAGQIQSPIDQEARIQSLSQLRQKTQAGQQELQMNQMKIQEAQHQQAEQSAAQRAYQDANGDIDTYFKLLPKYGVSQDTVTKQQKGVTEYKKSLLELSDAEHKQRMAKNAAIASSLDGILSLPDDETRQAAWPIAVKSLTDQQYLSPEEAQQFAQYPGEQQVKMLDMQRKTSEQIDKQVDNERQAQIAKAAQEHNKAMEVPASEREFQAFYDPWLKSNNLSKNAANEMKARQEFNDQRRSAAAGAVSNDDAKSIAGAIISGDQPPTLTGLYRNAAPVRAELARQNYDLTTATRDWDATKRFMSTLNGSQQTRMRQSIETATEMLPNIRSLYNEWKASGLPTGYKTFNKAALAASKQLPGRAGQAAQLLEAQLADFTSDLGTIYRGGNASTDEALSLAKKNLEGDWSPETFERGLQLVEKNIGYRRNSILNSQPAGVSVNSPYVPPSQTPQAVGAGEIELEYGSGGKLRVKGK